MKKQKFYIIIRENTNKPSPNAFKVEGLRQYLRFDEVEGYIVEIKDRNGYPVKIGLISAGGWTATHIGTGLACTPSPEDYRGWKKDDLIKELHYIDFKRLEALTLHKTLAEKLAEHKEGMSR